MGGFMRPHLPVRLGKFPHFLRIFIGSLGGLFSSSIRSAWSAFIKRRAWGNI